MKDNWVKYKNFKQREYKTKADYCFKICVGKSICLTLVIIFAFCILHFYKVYSDFSLTMVKLLFLQGSIAGISSLAYFSYKYLHKKYTSYRFEKEI